jgi:hypothetical protein
MAVLKTQETNVISATLTLSTIQIKNGGADLIWMHMAIVNNKRKRAKMTDAEFVELFTEIVKKLGLESDILIEEDRIGFPVGKWSREETERILSTISDYVQYGKNSH